MSVAKSFTSALVGIALADGLIDSIDDPVTKYVGFLEGTGYEKTGAGSAATVAPGPPGIRTLNVHHPTPNAQRLAASSSSRRRAPRG